MPPQQGSPAGSLESPASAEARATAEPLRPQPHPAQWLVVKCLELARTDTSICDKAAKASSLQILEQIGQGTFGRVHKAVNHHSGLLLAVKTLAEDNGNEFVREVSLRSTLQHPNVVQLVDVFARPKKSLVFVYAGPNLHVCLVAGVVSQDLLPGLALQLFEGLAHMHDNFVTHTDIKPRNLSWDTERKHLTILDLGGAVVSLPGYRSFRLGGDIRTNKLRYCTLPYRAPELCMGDSAWGFTVDCWASALVMAEVWNGGGGPIFQAASLDALMTKVFARVGSPVADDLTYFKSLPLFSDQYPFCPVPRSVLEAMSLPARGAPPAGLDDLIRSLVALNPSKRLTARAAVDRLRVERQAGPARAVLQAGVLRDLSPGSAASEPDRSTSLLKAANGQSLFHGRRGPFSLREGRVAPALVAWLKEDLAENTWSWKPRAVQKDRSVEFNQKLEICGHVEGVDKLKGRTLNGKDARAPLDRRLVAFALALKQVGAS